jgi:predicted DNA-binding transcriptional regulator AlpA
MELLTQSETAKKVRASVDHFRKVIKHEPDFPKPVKLTPNGHPKWSDEAIDNYLKKKTAN